MAAKFYIYERKRAGKPSAFYVRFRSETGTIGPVINSKTNSKKDAEAWAIYRLVHGETVKPGKTRLQTFGEWAAPWWKYETCPYVREMLAGGFSLSPQYVRVRRSYLEQHLLPVFQDRPLIRLKPADFRDYKMKLLAAGNLSPATINRILGTVRVMFAYAVRMGELETNPISPVTELKETPRVRGILTIEELRKLFAPNALATVWHNDLRHYAMNLLAASGGLRLGEVQALQVKHVHKDHVEVRYSWDDKFGRSEPKWGSARIVPIPSRTAEALDDLLALQRWGLPLPDDVVLWGRDRETPLTKTAILAAFKTAVGKIGISEEQRRARTLVFHSYRHLFNTLVRGQVPDEQLRRVTGHKGIAMTDSYDHAGTEQLRDVLAVQESIFQS